jgi:sugar porter (SP) family MFS transporter
MQQSYGATDTACSVTNASIDETHKFRVILFTCFLCLVVTAEGYDVGVLNGAVIRMKDDLGISTLAISWVVTMTPLFIMPGSLVGGALADGCGRRGAFAVCCLLLIVGPVGMAASTSLLALLVARAVVGFGIGMGFVVVSMYIAEVAPAEMRGRLTTLEEVFLNIGMLLGYLANFLLYGIKNDWRWMLSFGSVLPLIVFVLTLFPQMPESPRWLSTRGRTKEAEDVLTLFVGEEEARRDIQAMSLQQKEHDSEEFVSWRRVLCSWHDPKIRHMLLAAITVACAQTACGYLAIAYYSSTVLKLAMDERTAFMATVAMGVVKLVVVLFTLAILEKVGRRPMLLVSTFVCGLACVWLATAFAMEAGAWVQALGFVIFMGGFSLGLGPITFVYVAEVFSTCWRAKGMALALFASRIIGASSTLLFPLLIDAIGVSTCFCIMIVINVCVIALIWCFVFETHGMTLENVDALYKTQDGARHEI